MPITYSTDKPIAIPDLHHLFEQTTWATNREPGDIATMMTNSLNLGAWDGHRLVGYARVVTDGVYRSLIEDVIVDGDYRGQGIGRGLIETLLDMLDTEQVVLFCDPANEAFYDKFGFDLVTASAMHIWRGEVE
jgi:GNAT superfamily N-acetyltransferase